MVSVVAVMLEEQPGDQQQHPGQQVGRGDHLLAPDRVEQRAEHQGTDQVPGGEGDRAVGRIAGGDAQKGGQHRRIAEQDRVVEEGLAHEQPEAQDRTLRVQLHQRPEHLGQRDGMALADGDGLVLGDIVQLPAVSRDAFLDVVDDALGFVLTAMDEQPARALWHVAADQEDDQPQHATQYEGQPPAQPHREDRLVEHQHGEERAADGPQPVAPLTRDRTCNTRGGQKRP
jgi:hypothetical protein